MELRSEMVQQMELSAYELLAQCRDPHMKKVVKLIDMCSNSRAVLVTGETGTGKELVANALKERGDRSSQRLVVLDCTQFDSHVMRSELFGHEKGAFTGAIDQKIGLLERADKATAFLDEIGELPLEMQPRLLRVLQGSSFFRVGGTVEVKSDMRLIAASNRDLLQMMRDGKFREDLYYRLEVFQIAVPPLRERGEDVLRLAEHFTNELSDKKKSLGASATGVIMKHVWPGNVRELRNTIERAVTFSNGEKEITAEHLHINLKPKSKK